jgi:hypothetical protein
MSNYYWTTDAASGYLTAESMDEAVSSLVTQGEWSDIDSAKEAREIADGATLLVRNQETLEEFRR